MDPSSPAPRRRLSRSQRHEQLLDAARILIRDAGTDQFTLARLAERAGVTKPLVYDHFGDRTGVFAELYRDFESRQRDMLRRALDDREHELSTTARLVAGAYIDCCLAEGRELGDVVAALAGSSALSRLREEADEAYLAMCQAALEPLSDPIHTADLQAIIGAGDALARSMLLNKITADHARGTLTRIILAIAGHARSNDRKAGSGS